MTNVGRVNCPARSSARDRGRFLRLLLLRLSSSRLSPALVLTQLHHEDEQLVREPLRRRVALFEPVADHALHDPVQCHRVIIVVRGGGSQMVLNCGTIGHGIAGQYHPHFP
jgi:hypothetical protein